MKKFADAYSMWPMLSEAWGRRREIAGVSVYWSGIARLYEWAARPQGAIVLMYHSIANDELDAFIDPRNRISPTLFERQMQFLSKYRRVISLSTMIRDLASGSEVRADTVALTFDDGYLDTLTNAAPILARYGLPATVFLATGYIGRGENQWSDVLHWAFLHATRWPSDAVLGGSRVHLDSVAGRAAARKVIHRRLLEADYAERTRLLTELTSCLQPTGTPPRLSMLWEDVRQLRRLYPKFEIGGHTRNHIDLSRHQGVSAQLEISDCAKDIEKELGEHPEHFSFPYGRWSSDTREAVVNANWHSAAADGAGVRVDRHSDRFLLPRTDAPRSMSELRFKTSGAYPGVFSLFGRQ